MYARTFTLRTQLTRLFEAPLNTGRCNCVIPATCSVKTFLFCYPIISTFHSFSGATGQSPSGRSVQIYTYPLSEPVTILNEIIVRIYSGALAQRSTMGKEIRLSMHPRNFGSEKIVRTYLRTSTRSCKRMLSVLPYIHVMIN